VTTPDGRPTQGATAPPASGRGLFWPCFVGFLLLFTVGANVAMLVAASSDANGAVVEPDYYRKAVAWDSLAALRAASAALGWSAHVEVSSGDAGVAAGGAGGGEGSVRIALSGPDGAPVRGARVQATLIHNADAGRPLRLTLREESPGRYAARAPIAHRGRWEVRTEALRGAARFLDTGWAEAR
jgi:nitrogen fixation protein FixH